MAKVQWLPISPDTAIPTGSAPSSLLDTVKAVRHRLNPKLEIEGLLRTMYDVRNNLGNEVSAQLTQHFGDKVLRSIIPRNVRLAEAPSHGQPIHLYDRSSRGAIAYIGLAGEMIRRERGLPGAEHADPDAVASDTAAQEKVDAPATGNHGPTLKAPAANQQD
ncbi:MAG: hypothetical protein WDW36_007224 [Sanguina aurantia]